MDRWKYFDIIHRDHLFWNPLDEAKVGEIIELLRLAAAARVLDIACGRGEFLFRVLERWGASGVGVDRSPFCAAGARERAAARGLAARVEIVEGDGAEYDAPPASFDLASCLGASWIWGGHAGTLEALARQVRPGGLVLAGEPFWRSGPSPGYLAATGYAGDMFGSHHGNVQAGIGLGLQFLYSVVSSADDFDRYEGLQWYAAEHYAVEHPADPDLPEILGRVAKYRDAYLQWGRDELGWALYLFRKP